MKKTLIKDYAAEHNVTVQSIYAKVKKGTLYSSTIRKLKYILECEKEDNTELENKISELETELKRLNELEENNLELENKISELETELKRLNELEENNLELENKISELETEVDNLEFNNSRLLSKNSILKIKLNKKVDNTELKNKIYDLEDEVVYTNRIAKYLMIALLISMVVTSYLFYYMSKTNYLNF